jgi:peptide/nickel transport system substrate-binding protein
VRHRARALVVSAVALSLAVAGCSKNTGGTSGGGGSKAPEQQAIIIDTKGTTPVPAPDVPGAKQGGTITWLEDGASEHLAPQQIYVSDALDYATNLIYRSLTGYIEPSNGGPLKLVGDLATNTGETSDGGKTWTYHLRDGIKFEDGSPILAKDVAFGVAISMGDLGAQGPQYLHNALDPSGKWTPDQGDIPPGVTVPDDKTIVFKFTEAHPEMPFLGAMPTTVPVPKAKYTKDKYEQDFVADGPYKRESWDRTTKLVLVKNTNWDPKTDPIRHQYADKFVFDFTSDRNAQTQRLIADSGPDQTAVMSTNVAQSSIAQVQADANASKRVLSGSTPFANYVYINTQRVTDVDVRKALNLSFDRDAWIKALGGTAVAASSTTLMAPVVPGYKKYDAYPVSSTSGDPDKAKQMISGKTVPKLKYCFRNTSTEQQYASVIKTALERGGFQIALNPIDKPSFYTTVGVKGTDCDLIRAGWGQDYPDGQSTLDVLFNGKNIVPKGNNNLSYFDQPDINSKLTALNTEPDRVKAATEYGDLDQEIMTKYAPVIPTHYTLVYSLMGSKVGGVFNSPLYAEPNLCSAFVKS